MSLAVTYLGAQSIGGDDTATLINDQAYTIPIVVPNDCWAVAIEGAFHDGPSVPGNVAGVLYADDGGEPGTLVGHVGVSGAIYTIQDVDRWLTMPLLMWLPAGDYHVGVMSSSGTWVKLRAVTGGASGVGHLVDGDAAGTIPDPDATNCTVTPITTFASVRLVVVDEPQGPAAPVLISATALSTTTIIVEWGDVADETGYRVERSLDGVTGWADVSGNLPADTTDYLDTGLTPATEYCYRVFAFNDDGESAPSNVACATTFSESSVIPVPNPNPGDAWLRHPTIPALDMAVCVTETYELVRPFMSVQPIGGGLPTVVTGRPGGRNYTLVISVRSINEQRRLEDVLASPLVYYQPPCDRDLWMAPETESIVVTKVGRIRQTTVNFVETGPFPQPTPESFFEQPFPPPEEEPESPGESP